MKTVIVDLDGTICDVSHRIHHVQLGEWDDFNSKCLDDKPILDIIELVTELGCELGYGILAVTGREEKWKAETRAWLDEHCPCVDQILMRKSGDFRPDVEVKIALIEEHFGSKDAVLDEVWFALDDRDKVVAAMRDYGLTVLQVREGDY